jgi:hypothetical protein
MTLIFRGPSKYKKKDGKFCNLRSATIIEAYIDISGIVTPLEENRIVVEHYESHIHVYHTFGYYDASGQILFGRWSDDFPLNTFRQIKSLFRHVITGFEDGDYEVGGTAIFRVFFTEKAAVELRAFS